MAVGIIGGVSPWAFSQFYNELCNMYRNINGGVYPEIISYSIKVNTQQEECFLNSIVTPEVVEQLKSELRKGCEIFSKCKVETVIICCNTLSNIFCEVAKAYDFKNIVTPVNSVLKYIECNNIEKSLLLATGYTNASNLYSKHKRIATLNDSEQEILSEFINKKINQGSANADKVNEIIKKYENDITAVILGCTDISMQDIVNDNLLIIDSNKIMLENVLEFMR